MTLVIAIEALLVLALFCSNSQCHTWKFGDSPEPAAMKHFDGKKFDGKWYVIQVSSHINPCLSLDFEQLDNATSYSVTQMRELLPLVKLGRNKKISYTGTLNVPNPQEPADMLVKWPANIFGKSTYKVLDTDYVNYALVFESQKILFASRTSFSILSRKPTLEAATIQKLRDKVVEVGGDISSMTTVDQENCLSHHNSTQPLNAEDEFLTNIFEYNSLGLLNDQHILNISNTDDLINLFNWTIPHSNLPKTDVHETGVTKTTSL